MSISRYIRDNTNDGHNIARLLIDVMEGRIDNARVSHRLSAARLLTIYGYGDVDDSTNANTPEVSDRKWARRVRLSIGADLTKLIKANTDDGQAVVMFLIDVMEGRIEGIHVGYRLSAAKELLARAFGKSRSRDLPKPPGSKPPRRSTANKRREHTIPPEAVAFEARLAERVASTHASAPVHPELVEGQSIPPTQSEPTHQPDAPASIHPDPIEGPEPIEGQSIPPTQSEPTHQPDAPASIHPDPVEGPEPIEGQSVPPTQSATQTEPTHQSEPEANDSFDPNHQHY